jgi:hypothetical protein
MIEPGLVLHTLLIYLIMQVGLMAKEEKKIK